MTKKSFLLLLAITLAACTESQKPVPAAAPSAQPAQGQPASESSAGQEAPVPIQDEIVTYIPSRDRVLTSGDGQAIRPGRNGWISSAWRGSTRTV